MDGREMLARRIALSAVLTAIAVAIAPTLWFPAFGSKAYPGQHMINAIAGVLMGPWWASLIALFTGVIRMSLGIGTIYSMPGGIPGALVVGFAYEALRRALGGRRALIAALLEPVGTVLIGGTLALFIVAPAVGTKAMLSLLERGATAALLTMWFLWALSSVPGSIVGFLVLGALYRLGISPENLFRK